MTWETEKTAYKKDLEGAVKTIASKLDFLKSDTNIVNIINGDFTMIRIAMEIDAVVKDISKIDTELKTKLNTALTQQTAHVATSETLRTQMQEMEMELRKSRELEGIRKEQAESLHTKYAGNLHSSWLGLWTPLSDETRVAILVTTIALFACAIAILVFLIVGNHIALPGKPAFMGGSRFKTRTS